jgi:hypothetical protein
MPKALARGKPPEAERLGRSRAARDGRSPASSALVRLELFDRVDTTLLLKHLRERFDRLCDRLEGGHAYRDWFRTSPTHDGGAHVEREGHFFCYVVTERGSEYERRRTHDGEEMLFWLMSDVTFDMALKFELAHRRPKVDSRRLLFRTQEDLLHSLKATWADELRRKHGDILREHPFIDAAG